jgi:hypothetical protein
MAVLLPWNEALAYLHRFLRAQQLNPLPRWIFRDDVAADSRGHYFVRMPLPTSNPHRVRALYRQLESGSSGVVFAALCLLRRRPCCYIDTPEPSDDRWDAPVRGINLSVPRPLPHATPVTGTLQWWWLSRVADQRRGYDKAIDRVPSRGVLPGARLLPPRGRRARR